MEALQMLKFHLKKDHLKFMQNWVTPEKHMAEDDPDEDLLCNLLQGDFQAELRAFRQFAHNVVNHVRRNGGRPQRLRTGRPCGRSSDGRSLSP